MISQAELKIGLVIANRDLRNEVEACLRGGPVRVLLDQPGIDNWAQLLQQVDFVRPDVLLLDLTHLGAPVDEALRRIKATLAAPMIIALNTAADPESILNAMRAGANEYLYPPLETGLRNALVRMAGERAKHRETERARGRTLGFFSAKGGCGATTVACHLAMEMQRVTAQHVLLADFDIGIGVLGFLMKVKTPYTVLDAAKNLHRLDQSYWKALISNGHPNLDIIPAPGPAGLREAVAPEQFRHVLRFARTMYDWVFADLGRSLSPVSLGLMEDIDQAFLLATPDVHALLQARQVIQTLLEYGYSRKRIHLVLNRMPKAPDLTPGEVQKALGLPPYAALPNNYSELYEAYSEGKLVGTTSELGRDLTRLAQKIAGVAEETKERTKSKLSIFF